MNRIRSRFGNQLVSTRRAGGLLRSQKDFRGGGVIADQTPTRKNKGKVWTPFLGRETPFYQGIFVLPFLTQLPAYYITMVRLSRGTYEAEIHKMSAPPYSKNDFEPVQKFIQFSEAAIRSHPADWLWSHNRWKYARTENEELLNFR